MGMKNFQAVILAGGSGERFWPLSTAARPKQFLSVFGEKSLIRLSFDRLGDLCAPENVHVITGRALIRATKRELPEIPSENVVGEPMRRDTGAAVALGVGVSAGEGDPVIGVFSSDQLVARPAQFRAAVRKAIGIARKSRAIVTIGIRPTYPATGFGYVDPATGKFVEKPDAEKAKCYLEKGFLWNAGMFIARASTFRAAFAAHAPALSSLAETRYTTAKLRRLYEGLSRISFDYAVMEKYETVAVVPGDFGWDDVGGYGAFERYYPHDAEGNVVSGEVKTVESADNICIAKGPKIALLGVKDLVVVSTKDAVLVVSRSRAGELKKLFA